MIRIITRILTEMDSIKMLIRLIWIILFLGQGFGRAPVCMEKEVNEEMITVNCTVDDFVSDIDFKFPNKTGEAYCVVPVTNKIQCKCQCNLTRSCQCNVTQDIPTKTTTLRIWNTDLTGMLGWYTCAHGSFERSIIVDRHLACRRESNADGQKNEENVYIVVCTLTVTLSISFSVLICVFPDIPGRMKNMLCRRKDIKQGSLYSLKRYGCTMCYNIPICGICVDCKRCFCDTCCKHHVDNCRAHKVCQIQHTSTSHSDLKCRCLKLAERICGKCWNLFCAKCANEHKHDKNEIVLIYQAPLESRQKKYEDVPEKLTQHSILPIDKGNKYPVRIVGIGYLADGRVVAADGNNCHLIIFKPGENQQIQKIADEPNAMTSMTENKIAVTYPNSQYIGIHQITLKTSETPFTFDEHKDISMVNIGLSYCKPYSIAYNKEILAVEVGTGKDGMIIILNYDERFIIKKIKCNFANFTGVTIRLGLILDRNDIQGGQVIVSAIGKKMVSCMDFEGEKLWHVSIPSPRSIIVLDDYSLNIGIVLSSRRCDAIYELAVQSEQNGDKRDISKIKDKINSPRFMAYNRVDKTLCVLVENKTSDDHEDEFAFLKFNKNALRESMSHEQSQSMSLEHSKPATHENIESTSGEQSESTSHEHNKESKSLICDTDI